MVLLLIQPHQREPQSDSRSSISCLSPVQKISYRSRYVANGSFTYTMTHQREPQSDSRSSISRLSPVQEISYRSRYVANGSFTYTTSST